MYTHQKEADYPQDMAISYPVRRSKDISAQRIAIKKNDYTLFLRLARLDIGEDGISYIHLDLLQHVFVNSLDKKSSSICSKPASPFSD